MPRQELARFLRERREGMRPAESGLPPGGRRRTPGLRREEVAGLAHLSVEHYARLEQARGPRPSARVLAGLAGALRLDAAERAHLFRLAGVVPPPPPGPPRQVRPYVADLLRRLPWTGAVVTDAAYDVVAYNQLAEALLGGLARHPNLARRRFLGGGGRQTREPADDAEEFGGYAVARLRTSVERYPDDPRLAGLVAELRSGSGEFASLWEARPVRAPGHRVKTLDHPGVGPLRVECDVLPLPEDDQQVVFITAERGSAAERAFRRLAGA
ncbi:helix-turn-helix transcriptional regulator [Actinacidiphila yeochonensis]|uniref:helix-turn-helix transcriptional regulator n=1 Tax=Actinacidiphila yeochonensis TaxID=89050 RepID=UPI000568FB3B|nr:helix-turn-helix transcriptional regulator [Actinacidiphila yeochonensis]